MSLKRRFFIVIAVVVLGFFSVGALTSLFVFQIKQLKTASTVCDETIASLKQLQLLTAELLSTEELDETVDQWRRYHSRFSRAMKRLNDSSHVRRLLATEEQKSILESMHRFWLATREKLDTVAHRVEKRVGSKLFSRNGLLLQYFDHRTYENFNARNNVYQALRYLRSDFEMKLTRLTTMVNHAIDKRFHQLILRIVIISFVIAAAVSLILISFLSRLQGYLARLHRAMGVIGRGNFTEKLPARGKDELAQISRAVNLTTDQLSSIHRELEQRIDQLSIARKEAESASRAKTVFLANMSHDLKTPLNAILGFSHHIYRTRGLSEQQQKDLSIINRSGKHLLSMINDILAMSRIDAGKARVDTVDVNLSDLLDDVRLMFQPRAREKTISFEIVQHAGLPRYVATDGVKLRQVLTNLIDNAMKCTDQGSVTVTVKTDPSAGGNDHQDRLVFEIQDTGRGIAQEDRESVFDAFVQLEGGQAQEGTGLGLSICRDYVRRMGGNIFLESSRGQGSRFSFHLPVEKSSSLMSDATEPLFQGEPQKKAEQASPLDKTVPGAPMMHSDDTDPETVLGEAMTIIPDALLGKLEQAALFAEMDRIDLLIDRIEAYDATVAKHLRSLADRFDYDKIAVLLVKKRGK